MTSLVAIEELPTPTAPVVRAVQSPVELIALAIEHGTPVEHLKELMALQRTLDDRNAEKAFYDALAEFQRVCPPIKKTKTARFPTNSGGMMSYMFAPIDEIARTVNPLLSALGLSYGFDTKVSGGNLTVTCTLRHRLGFSVPSTQEVSTESKSPGMSAQQKTGAALTFAKRLALTNALGLTTTEDDIDGEETRSAEKISDVQVSALEALIVETGADLTRFLAFMGVKAIGDITDYQKAYNALVKKRKTAK